MATSTGHSRWVTGPDARERSHILRSHHDAVAVGIGTALADDPRLDARIEGASQPWHVVFDSGLRLPGDARLIVPEKTLVLCAPGADREGRAALEAAGARVVEVPRAERGLDITAALDACATAGLLSVFVEGGPTLAASFLRSGHVNRVYAFIAPKLLGTGLDAVGDLTAGTMDDALQLRDPELERCGSDWMITGTLRDA